MSGRSKSYTVRTMSEHTYQFSNIRSSEIESVLWDDWHVVAELARLTRFRRFVTTLLGVCVTVELDSVGNVSARRGDQTISAVEIKYGFVWICLGTPARGIVEFAECLEPDRLLATAGSVRVAVSGLRAVENFLDLSHLAFVHA